MADFGNNASGMGENAGSGENPSSSIKDKLQQEAAALTAKAREAAAAALDKGRDVAASVVQKVGDVASSLGKKAEGARGPLGDEIKTLAGAIREKAPEGPLGAAAADVAGTLESGAAYLQQQNFQAMADDALNLVRRYPLQAVLIGIGVGFLLGRASRS